MKVLIFDIHRWFDFLFLPVHMNSASVPGEKIAVMLAF